jgi:hypothetical protein
MLLRTMYNKAVRIRIRFAPVHGALLTVLRALDLS